MKRPGGVLRPASRSIVATAIGTREGSSARVKWPNHPRSGASTRSWKDSS